ncbi:MAG: hypothetical protein KC422_12460 [Trueperaceae bacterium]|nr:hypothetical protein [Trueperaceae bacterium]
MRFLKVTLLSVCFLLGWAFAQRLSFQSSGVVSFEASEADIREALDCVSCKVLEPSLSSSTISVRVQRQGSSRYTLTVRQASSWTAFRLKARYTIRPRQASLYTTDWLELSAFPQTIYSGDSPVTDVSVDYRLVLSGEEWAGDFGNQVVYSIDSSSISHMVQLSAPPVALVKVAGKSDSSLSLVFDYEGLNAIDYTTAVETGRILPFTDRTLDAVYVYTNNPAGATFRLELFVLEQAKNSEASLPQLLLFDEALTNREFRITQPTPEFQLLVSPEDFGLKVDGSELPGTYRYALRYMAIMQP